ncbi:MAG: hypothetical protein CL610_06510 [Anaerolineaceae bacterium]|nr:hypothetical protein [Anaerolineaceae bacterium]
MSIAQWVFDIHSVPFVTLQPDQTLGDALSAIQSKSYALNHVFLVHQDAEDKWRAARFIHVLGQDQQDPILLDLKVVQLPLTIADDVISVNTNESSDDVVERLLQYAQQVFIVVDDRGDAIGVLANAELRDGDIEPVQFTALHGRPVTTEAEAILLVYAHLESLRDEIIADAEYYIVSHGEFDRPRRARLTPELKYGTQLTIVPELETQHKHLITFKQAHITRPWDLDWEVFPFVFTAHADAIGHVLPVHISIQVAGIEIADINVSLEIAGGRHSVALTPTVSSRMHQKIFISYAREDIDIVRRYYQAQIAAANDVFFDIESIRTGENWRTTVKAALDQTDFVQLFWSQHSATSRNVQFEWEYFLTTHCTDENCEGRLRPVYWEEPLPAIPRELRRINFRYIPFLQA